MVSYKFRPGRWLWGLIPLVLPFLGAWFLNTPIMIAKIAKTAVQTLKTGGFDEVEVQMSGRDAVLSGKVDAKEAIDKAVASVLAIRGVRRVDANNIRVVKPVVLVLPTINPLTGNNNTPEISGTWPSKIAKTLSVQAGEKSYVLGKDPQLTSDSAGNWTLKLTAPLADGSHDIAVSITDGKKAAAADDSKGELSIDTTAPAAPSLASKLSTKNTKPIISGTYAHTETKSLTVMLADKVYILGKDKALAVDGKGGWTLTVPKALDDGAYEVTVKTADELGNFSTSTTPAAVTIDTTAPKAPTVISTTSVATTPVFKGTWVEETGNKLKVVVAGKVFALGRDKQLTSDGKGNWTLSLTRPLGAGNHSVLVETSDAFGNLARSAKPTIVSVNVAKPAEPTINKTVTRSTTPQITGSWSQDAKSTLSVVFSARSYVLGKDSELVADTSGKWTLQPTGQLVDGGYAVAATVTNEAGKSATTTLGEAVVVDTKPPPPPTVTTVLTRNRTPLITGSWDSSDAVSLNVQVAGQIFDNAIKGQIVINGDHWSVQPTKPIADGAYDVIATAGDLLGNTVIDLGSGELLIDGTSPQIPTVRPVFGTNLRPTITGTWQQDGKNTLSVTIAGQSYTPTDSGPLVSDGKGNWKLSLTQDLKPGSYDVQVKVADRLGNQSNDVSNGEVWIKTAVPKPKAVPKAAPKAKAEKPKEPSVSDCQREFTAALSGQSVVFKTNKAQITAASDGLLARLAEIAKACPLAKIEISGYTDSQGSDTFNQSLSEARASSVVDALVSRGVAKKRLRAVGHGERRPVANNSSDEGRALNRRIEFKVEN